VNVVTGRPVAEPPPAAAMLIRPDGYVAWASDVGAPNLAAGLPEALRTWFGAPAQEG
jgi:Aromatic-ring hydroxylase, C-terminal